VDHEDLDAHQLLPLDVVVAGVEGELPFRVRAEDLTAPVRWKLSETLRLADNV
jgi:hypothetical protein